MNHPSLSTASLNFAVRVYGLQIGVELSSSDCRDVVLDHLPPGWAFDSSAQASRSYRLDIAEGSQEQHRLYRNGDLLHSHRNLDQILRRFEADVQLYVGEMCEDFVFVHAGVVSWRGQVIVIPGRSFSGKTTLVRSLVEAGAEYYSDEYAVFDRHGRVHPYPRPLGVRSLRDATRRRWTIQELNGVCGTRPRPASLIVSTRYVSGATWNPRPISPGRAALLLFANAVAARRQADFALATLAKAVSGAVALESPRSEAHGIPDLLLSALREPDFKTQIDRRELCFQMQEGTT